MTDAATADGCAGVAGDATRNVELKRADQSGADAVITSAGAAGRPLGLSVLSPAADMVMEDLIQQDSGLDLVERPVVKAEVGRGPRETDDLAVSVVRGHRVLGYDDPAIGILQLTDRLITIVRTTPGAQVTPDPRPLSQD